MNEVIYEPKGRAQEYSWLAINHYTGCGHGCKYCYVPDFTHNFDFFKKQSIKEDILGRIRKQAPKFAGTNIRVLLCFSCDAYQPLDEVTKLTREIIKILLEFDIPFQILTKGGKRAVRDFDLYGKYDVFGTTLTFLHNADSSKHEPNAPLPGERIASLIAAKSSHIKTFASLEPVVDAKQSLEIIRQTHEHVDLFRIGKLNSRSAAYKKIESEIDWRKFGIKAIELCRKFETDYYIKDDLAAHLNGITFCNIDTRKIKRTEPSKAIKSTSLFE